MQNHIRDRINQALQETFAEDGLAKYLKALVIEGYRSEVTDGLIDVLSDQSRDRSERSNAEQLIYYLHGTGPALFFGEKIPDPRPENARRDEPLSDHQLQRILDLALRERDERLLGGLAALLDVLYSVKPFTAANATRAKQFVTHSMTFGDTYAVARSRSLSEKLQGHE